MEAIGDEVQISAKNGTTNTISDGTSHTDTYVDSDGNTNPVNGAIFSRDDLKLKGKGTLIVNGNTEDGIVCKNDLKIWNGSITVNAADDGIRGNDSVRIGDPDATDYSTLSVMVNTNNGSTGGDGIKSNSTETDKGLYHHQRRYSQHQFLCRRHSGRADLHHERRRPEYYHISGL